MESSSRLRAKKTTRGTVYQVTIPVILIRELGWDDGDVLYIELVMRPQDRFKYLKIYRARDLRTRA